MVLLLALLAGIWLFSGTCVDVNASSICDGDALAHNYVHLLQRRSRHSHNSSNPGFRKDMCDDFVVHANSPNGLHGHYDVVIAANTWDGNAELVTRWHHPFHSKQLDEIKGSQSGFEWQNMNALFLYVTNVAVDNSTADYLVDLDAKASYGDAQQRFLKTWKFIAHSCAPFTFDWYYQIDDDTAVSLSRLMLFARAIELNVGSPQHVSAIYARNASWQPGTAFGGNGILVTRLAFLKLGALSGNVWDEAIRIVHDDVYDHIVSHLVMTLSPSIALYLIGSPFGVGFAPTIFELTKASLDQRQTSMRFIQAPIKNILEPCNSSWQLSKCPLLSNKDRVSVSLHRARAAQDFVLAQEFFASLAPTLDEYASIIRGELQLDDSHAVGIDAQSLLHYSG